MHLELGGKSASVVLDDADFEKAVARQRAQLLHELGPDLQRAHAHARAEGAPRRSRGDRQEGRRDVHASAIRWTARTRLGPLVSAAQRDRVRGYIRKGIEEGAKLVTGGPEQPEGLPKGYFVKPTVFADVRNDMTIAQEEIFGPVLSIIAYDDENDAVRIANDTIYGLAGGVWSGDPERAKRVARRMRTGQVDINGGSFNLLAPFGGYKQSGNGRELGKFGLDEFMEIKAIQS